MMGLSAETLLAALLLLAADPHVSRAELAGYAVAESEPAQPSQPEPNAATPTEQPARPVEPRSGTSSEQSIINPFAPSDISGGSQLPSTPGSPARGLGRGQAMSRMAMPADPFATVPRVSTAVRPAAVYGIHVGPAPAVGGGKAFAGYRPASPISPYMSLYAPRTRGVDNYNAYVRPQLEQQAFNRQVDSAVRDLSVELSLPEMPPRTFEQIPQLYPVGPGVNSASYMSDLRRYYPEYPGSGNAGSPASQPQTSTGAAGRPYR